MDYAALSADYGEYHRARGNRACHAAGLPLIVYALTAWSRFGTPCPFVALILPLYFIWDGRVGAIMTAFIAAGALAAGHLPGWTSWAAFSIGWAFQFYGHAVYEKRSPAFAKNIAHLLIGPAWVATELFGLRKR
ncbi:MAG: Mpo1-like protein [Elusimicrobiota bacterium]